mgnify:CR=1 FL=1
MENEYMLSQEDIMLLNLVDKKYKYIVRDKSGELFVFERLPVKDKDCSAWVDTDGEFSSLQAVSEKALTFIKWEDKKPYKIKDLLGVNDYVSN